MATDEENTRMLNTASKILESARNLSKSHAGILPGVWILALIDELAFMSVHQRKPDADPERSIETLVTLLRDSISDYTKALTVEQGDSVELLIARAIKRGAEKR